MKEILLKLNENPGIRGSMVMTQDGIVAAAALGPDLEEEVVAALSSTLLTAVKRAVHEVTPEEDVTAFVLMATDGKLVFLDLDNAYLVVVTKRDLELNTTMVEIESAGKRIRTRGGQRALSSAAPA